MQKLIFSIFLIMLLFSSCTKEKEASLFGAWLETAIYSERQSGAFEWANSSRYPRQMILKENGEYFTISDIPESHGVYGYNHATRQIRFDPVTSGTSYVNRVSVLNDEILQIDLHFNGMLIRKVKYQRH